MKLIIFGSTGGIGRNIVAQALNAGHQVTAVARNPSALATSPELSFPVRMMTKLLQRILKNMYSDLLKMEQAVKETNLDWTVVRPPKLTNGRLKGKYRFAVNEWLPHCTSISRADLAHFMLQHSNDLNTYKSIIEVAY